MADADDGDASQGADPRVSALRDITQTLHNIPPNPKSKSNSWLSPNSKFVKRQRLSFLPMTTATTTTTNVLSPRNRPFSDRDHLKLQIVSLQSQVSYLKGETITLKNQLSKDEFAFTQLDDHYISLKDELASLEAAADQAANHKRLEIANIQNNYTWECKHMKVAQEKRENLLKEKFTNEAAAIIQNCLSQQNNQIKQLRSKCDDRAARNNTYTTDLHASLAHLRATHATRLAKMNKEIDDTIIPLQERIANLDEKSFTKKNEILSLEAKKTHLEGKLGKYQSILDRIQAKSASKVEELNGLDLEIKSIDDQTHALESLTTSKLLEMEALVARNKQIDAYLRDQEENRRQLHNKLQELKGNIRVFCRIRPSSSDQVLADIRVDPLRINADGREEVTLQRPHQGTGAHLTQELKFQFDKVFPETLSNQHVFDEISQLIQSCLDGYNVCVFAYGQTGLGKTFTMSTPQDGVIPLSLQKIYRDISALRQKGWDYEVHGQFIEIYNDSIVDLLAPNETAKYEIKHDDIAKTTSVSNVRLEVIDSIQQAQALVAYATKNRTTASTMSNERSSRSHSIFTIKLQGRNTETGATCRGSLNMIDLAGLERLVSSQAKGDRLKETQAINKSLSSLGDVIYALNKSSLSQTSFSPHIPYRNSKLTYLLKHSLGGNSKTLMFVNVSSSLHNFNETVSSLRFATKVNSTKVAD